MKSLINCGSRSPSPNDAEANLSRSASKGSIRSLSTGSDGPHLNRKTTELTTRSVSRNQSISPVRTSKSSRASSVSSVSDIEHLKPEEISDNDLESENEEENPRIESPVMYDSVQAPPEALNMSHEDLSDVSDLESEASDLEDKDENNGKNQERMVSKQFCIIKNVH